MGLKLPLFCKTEVRSTARKYAAQYVVDAAQCGRAVHTTCCSHDDLSLAARMMIEMFGPDIEAVDEAKALTLKSVNAWKNYKKRVPSRGSQGARAPSTAQEAWLAGRGGLVSIRFS